MDNISLNGQTVYGSTIELFGAKLMVIKTSRGMLGCGYLNVQTAEKLGHALAVVTGVASYGDMLKAEVKLCSAAAAALGVAPGMTGAEALEKMS